MTGTALAGKQVEEMAITQLKAIHGPQITAQMFKNTLLKKQPGEENSGVVSYFGNKFIVILEKIIKPSKTLKILDPN